MKLVDSMKFVQARAWAHNFVSQTGERGATLLGKLYLVKGDGCYADGDHFTNQK